MSNNWLRDNKKIMSEWDWDKNNATGLDPHNLKAKSNLSAYWTCSECGHNWEAVIASRLDSNCPKCARKKAGVSSSKRAAQNGNSIAEKYPDIAMDWDYELNPSDRTPYNVSPGSDNKFYWICNNGHPSYYSTVASRVAGNGCKECAKLNRKISFNKTQIAAKGSLADNRPALALEWDYEKNHLEYLLDNSHPQAPEECTIGSKKQVWWKCKNNHTWKASVYSRKDGTGCPDCDAERRTSFPEKCIVYYLRKVTEVESQYKLGNRLTLDMFLPEYNTGIEYDGEAWHKNISRDLKKNELCKKQGIRLIRILEPACKDIVDENVICIRLNGSKNDDMQEAIYQIIQDLNIDADVDIDISRDNTTILSTYITRRKEQNLESEFPKIAAQWYPSKNMNLTPDLFKPQSNQKVWWLGTCGHEWDDTISHRTTGSRGCPYCSGKRILKGFNDLKTRNPKLAAEWHPTKNTDLLPDEISANSHKKAWWLCPVCGYEWEAQIKSRNQGRGCRSCSGRVKS